MAKINPDGTLIIHPERCPECDTPMIEYSFEDSQIIKDNNLNIHFRAMRIVDHQWVCHVCAEKQDATFPCQICRQPTTQFDFAQAFWWKYRICRKCFKSVTLEEWNNQYNLGANTRGFGPFSSEER